MRSVKDADPGETSGKPGGRPRVLFSVGKLGTIKFPQFHEVVLGDFITLDFFIEFFDEIEKIFLFHDSFLF